MAAAERHHAAVVILYPAMIVQPARIAACITDFDLVANPARRDQDDCRPTSLQNRVGGNRRAVNKTVSVGNAVCQTVEDALHQSSGVVGTLRQENSPVVLSRYTKSVNVPPTLIPTLNIMSSLVSNSFVLSSEGSQG